MMAPVPPAAADAGFSLIEVLVAMAVLAVAAAGFVGATERHIDTIGGSSAAPPAAGRRTTRSSPPGSGRPRPPNRCSAATGARPSRRGAAPTATSPR